jgi:hypothetical protein
MVAVGSRRIATSRGEEMNEQQWEAAEDPIDMLLRPPPGISATDRKIRLFSCACCRRIWDKTSRENRAVVEFAEQYADGLASGEELAIQEKACRLYQDVDDPEILPEDRPPEYWCDVACWHSVTARAVDGYYEVCDATRRVARDRSGEWEDEVQARLLRDLFGPLPFRRITISSAVLSWNDATAIRLAQAAYDQRELPAGILDKGRLGVLADALEEAGCTDQVILSHLRGPEPHVRGCWVVDLLLGKE